MSSQFTSKQGNLFFVLVTLALFKFVIVPLNEWQNEQIVDVVMKQKQLSKTEQLIANKAEIEQRASEVNKHLRLLETKVPAVNLDSFKIDTQKELTKLLSEHSIRVERAAWIADPDPEDIYQVTIQLSLSGRMSDFLSSHFAIEKAYPSAKITMLRSDIRRHAAKSLGLFRGRISLSFWVRNTTERANG